MFNALNMVNNDEWNSIVHHLLFIETTWKRAFKTTPFWSMGKNLSHSVSFQWHEQRKMGEFLGESSLFTYIHISAV